MASFTPAARLLGCTLAALLSGAAAVWAGVNAWTTNGPYLTVANDLAIHPHDPSTLYAATGEGIGVSTDAGAAWRDAGALGAPAFAVAIDPLTPSTLYAATYCELRKSLDGGESWTTLDIEAGARRSCNFYKLAVDPGNSDVVYAASLGDSDGCPGCYRGSVYRSADGGVSWTDVGAALDTYDHGALIVDADSNVYVGTDLGALRSADGGATWTLGSEGLPAIGPEVFALAIDPANPSTLYAGTYRGVFRSFDAGASWSPLLVRDAEVFAVAVDPRRPATLYAGMTSFPVVAADGGILRSTDGGVTWRNVRSDAGSRYPLALAVAASGPPAVYAGTYGDGVVKSVDGGDAWARLDLGGSTGASVTALAVAEHHPRDGRGFTLYAATLSAGIHRSVDGGKTWGAANAGLTDGFVGSLVVDPGAPEAGLPAIVHAGASNRVFSSFDGGETWSAGRRLCDYCPIASLAVDRRDTPGSHVDAAGGKQHPALPGPAAVYAGSSAGLFRSRDGGATWQDVTEGLPQRRVSALAVDDHGPAPGEPSIVYLALGDGLVWRRVGTRAWARVSVPSAFVTGLATSPGRPVSGDRATVFATTSSGLLRSDDGGATWTRTSCGTCDDANALAVDPRRPDTLYAATFGKVDRSDDGGLRWSRLGIVPGEASVQALELHPWSSAVLFAGTSAGVFEWTQVRCEAPGGFCAQGDRFAVEVLWRDFAGQVGLGRAASLRSRDSGVFWFFSPDNWEMLLKVLDGCRVNGRWWVFAAAATNVEYTLRVTDTATGEPSVYFNPLGRASPAVTDTDAFAVCDPVP
jgi:photosystem II stability/assembly factor-like uncharacterized protein